MYSLFDPCPEKPSSADVALRMDGQDRLLNQAVNGIISPIISALSEQTQALAQSARAIVKYIKQSNKVNARKLDDVIRALDRWLSVQIAEQGAILNRVIANMERDANEQEARQELIASTIGIVDETSGKEFLPPVKVPDQGNSQDVNFTSQAQLGSSPSREQTNRFNILREAAENLGFTLPPLIDALTCGGVSILKGTVLSPDKKPSSIAIPDAIRNRQTQQIDSTPRVVPSLGNGTTVIVPRLPPGNDEPISNDELEELATIPPHEILELDPVDETEE